MRIYRIKNKDGQYITRSGYEDVNIKRARIWTRLGDVKQTLSRMKDSHWNGRKLNDWYVEESETSETLVSIKPGTEVIADSERRKAEREAARQRSRDEQEKERRRQKFMELQREFGNNP